MICIFTGFSSSAPPSSCTEVKPSCAFTLRNTDTAVPVVLVVWV